LAWLDQLEVVRVSTEKLREQPGCAAIFRGSSVTCSTAKAAGFSVYSSLTTPLLATEGSVRALRFPGPKPGLAW